LLFQQISRDWSFTHFSVSFNISFCRVLPKEDKQISYLRAGWRERIQKVAMCISITRQRVRVNGIAQQCKHCFHLPQLQFYRICRLVGRRQPILALVCESCKSSSSFFIWPHVYTTLHKWFTLESRESLSSCENTKL
jgi:hypothetical protein